MLPKGRIEHLNFGIDECLLYHVRRKFNYSHHRSVLKKIIGRENYLQMI
jgi:hypothetical protein